MDPNQLSIILGLLTNGLYSLALLGGKEVKDYLSSQERINELLMKNEANFISIFEGAF